MYINFTKAILLLFTTLISASIHAQIKGTMTDPRDGHEYKTVEIGNRIWMAQNLNYESTDSIFHKKFIEPVPVLNQFNVYMPDSYCYGNVLINCDKYGRLYHYEAATKACPVGWHLPDSLESISLLSYLQQAAGNDKYKLYQNLIPGGSSGFDLLCPGFGFGLFTKLHGRYNALGLCQYLWIKNVNKTEQSGYKSRYNRANILVFYKSRKNFIKCKIDETNSYFLNSVRCIKDSE